MEKKEGTAAKICNILIIRIIVRGVIRGEGVAERAFPYYFNLQEATNVIYYVLNVKLSAENIKERSAKKDFLPGTA